MSATGGRRVCGRKRKSLGEEEALKCENLGDCSLASATEGGYERHEARIQTLLSERATRLKGQAYAATALNIHKRFLALVLKSGPVPASNSAGQEEELRQMVRDYSEMLRVVYGDLVLDPYVLDIDAFAAYGDASQAASLHDFRLAQRRFAVYRSPAPKTSQVGPVQKRPVSEASCWDRNLQAIWAGAQKHLAGDDALGRSRPKYADIKSSEDPQKFSCHLQDATWEKGIVSKEGIADEAVPASEIAASKAGTRPGRLYFTDGTCPNYHETGRPPVLPGLSCAINDATNAMLPGALRSCRGDSLLRYMRVESTGVASFTLFAPLGPGTGLTAFHQETKQRRSFNCGTGDFIVQPLATACNVRQVERVHAAVLGEHGRHANLLPLEMYLEEGIPLVLYVRDLPNAEFVELPEQSCHAFISFATAHGTSSLTPSIKVSCNDWCVRRELSSAYLLERLVGSCERAGVGSGHPVDEADCWTESAYFNFQPCRLQQRTASHVAPWMLSCEDAEDEPPDARSWWMEVVLVRTCEHLLDTARGMLDADDAWTGDRLCQHQARDALQDSLPALCDLHRRTWTDHAIYGRGSKPAKAWLDSCVNFTREYLEAIITDICGLLRPPQAQADTQAALHPKRDQEGPRSGAAGKVAKRTRASKEASSSSPDQLPGLAPLPNGMTSPGAGHTPPLQSGQAVVPPLTDGSKVGRSQPQGSTGPAGPGPVISALLELPSGGVWHDFWQAPEAERERVAAASDALCGQHDLTCLSLPELRQHWLLALQCQADAADDLAALKSRTPVAHRRAAKAKLDGAYKRRCRLEACMDAACGRLLAMNNNFASRPASTDEK